MHRRENVPEQRSLEKTFQETVYSLLEKDTAPTFVLAVSAGVDSMVLLELFQRMAQKESRIEFVVAYVNHQLRQESQAEEELVSDYCRANNIKLYATKWHEGKTVAVGIEEAARNFRYDWFEQVMNHCQAKYVVTAHHSDDQVETILMKLIRGSRLSALTGMPKKRNFAKGYLIRPFLGLSKDDIYAFALQEGVKYLEDSSNQELVYQRNRVRLKLLPQIKKENPQFQDHLLGFSDDLSDTLEVLQPIIREKEKEFIQPFEDGWVIDWQGWQRDLSLAWQRLVLSYFFEQEFHAKGIFIKGKQVKSALSLMESDRPQAIIALTSQWQLRRTYQKLYIERVGSEASSYFSEQELLVTVPGEYILNENEKLSIIEVTDSLQIKEGLNSFQVNRSQLPLTIRHRKSGDLLQIGVNPPMHQSLKRWFINQKIPKDLRDKIWLVEDCQQNIVALLGYRTFQLSLKEETDRIFVNYRNHAKHD